jgi:hypothetical protein
MSDYGDVTYFIGPCTCDHEDTDHTWGACEMGRTWEADRTVVDPGCSCEAGWEE